MSHWCSSCFNTSAYTSALVSIIASRTDRERCFNTAVKVHLVSRTDLYTATVSSAPAITEMGWLESYM